MNAFPVMTSERRRMRELYASGLSYKAVAVVVGRSHNTIRKHLAAEIQARAILLRVRPPGIAAQRTERLFSDCNRVLREVAESIADNEIAAKARIVEIMARVLRPDRSRVARLLAHRDAFLSEGPRVPRFPPDLGRRRRPRPS